MVGKLIIIGVCVLLFVNAPMRVFSQIGDDSDELNAVTLVPTDDSYVIADLNDPEDTVGLRKINAGNLNFLKMWYAWNVTGAEGREIVSIVYLQFDLSEIGSPDQISSAKLRMFAQNVSLNSPRAVDVYLASGDPWKESTVNYITAPSFSTEPLASTSISSEKWYEWDVTAPVKDKAGANITLAILLEHLFINTEEQVIFASKDVEDGSLRPKLVIDTAEPALSDAVKTDFQDNGKSILFLEGLALGSAIGAVAVFLVLRKKRQFAS